MKIQKLFTHGPRWDSLVAMLKRFLLLFEAVKLALRELGSEFLLDSIDIEGLKQLVTALEPIAIIVETLTQLS